MNDLSGCQYNYLPSVRVNFDIPSDRVKWITSFLTLFYLGGANLALPFIFFELLFEKFL